MRIISKIKDYYDHCVNKFGYDETRVYDRRKMKHISGDGRIEVAICGVLYRLIKKNGQIFFGESPLLDRFENRFLIGACNGLIKTDLNEKYRSPVVCETFSYTFERGGKYGKHNKIRDFYIPDLSKLGFYKIIPPEEMYMRIYDYLGWLKDNPEIPCQQTDKEKVASHGFDVKESFRPKIKIKNKK